MKKMHVYELYNEHFHDSCAGVNDDLHCGQPANLTFDEIIQHVHNAVQSD
jgi:hypothetical protein